MSTEVRALTVEDARALKLAIAVVFGKPLRPGLNRLMDELGDIDTPHEEFATTIDKVSRLEANQHRLWKVHRIGEKPNVTVEFEWLVDETHIPGGLKTLARALFTRLCKLIGTPLPDDERVDDADPMSRRQVDQVAASLQIAHPEQSVH